MSRFGVRPIPSTMVRNNALHLPLAIIVVLSAITVVHGDSDDDQSGSHIKYVELTPNKNFSMPCDKIWLPVCAECSENKRTFPNHCQYYTARATKDESCNFLHFNTCPYACQEESSKRKLCTRDPDPLCARCGFEDLSFLNECEYNNYQCLYGNPCEIINRGYCTSESGKIIYQKFHEKTRIHKDTIRRLDVFDDQS